MLKTGAAVYPDAAATHRGLIAHTAHAMDGFITRRVNEQVTARGLASLFSAHGCVAVLAYGACIISLLIPEAVRGCPLYEGGQKKTVFTRPSPRSRLTNTHTYRP